MIYIIFEEKEVGCSCSPMTYDLLQSVLYKGGKPKDLELLRREFYNELEDMNPNAYVKRRNFGSFSQWLIREKGFKEAEYKSISL